MKTKRIIPRIEEMSDIVCIVVNENINQVQVLKRKKVYIISLQESSRNNAKDKKQRNIVEDEFMINA